MKKVIIIFLGLIPLQFFGQQDSLIPREVFFNSDDRKEFFKLNPSGDKVFYIKNIYEIGSDLFYYDINLKNEFKISFKDKFSSYFTFNNNTLLINFRNEIGQYFGVYNIETKELKILEGIKIDRSKIYDFNRDTNEAVAIIVGKEGEKGVYKFNLDGQFQLLRKAEGFLNLYFDGNLNIVAGEKPTQNRSKSFHYLKNDEWQLLREYDFREDMFVGGVNNIVSVSKDGSRVYFSDNSSSDKTNLIEFNVQTGKETTLIEPTKADIIPASIIFDKNSKPLSVVSLFGKPHRFTIQNSNIEEHIEILQKEINELHILDQSIDNIFWLVENMNGGANEYYRYDTKTKKLKFLFNDFPRLDAFPKNYRNSFVVKSFDDLELPINVYIREDLDKDKNGIPDKPLPTILYVHGGPWVGWMNNNWLITRNLHLLANRGYVVIFTEFRSASTYGKSFLNKSNNQWGDAMVKDKKAIAEWAIKNKVAISDKIGLFGWSYGGYATMAGLSFEPDTYACGIAMYGISDLESFLQTPFANNDTWKKRVANINTSEGVELAKKHSPINYINQIKVPLLLSTGGKDQRVNFSQSHTMADKMNAAGKEVSYIYYPDEVHDYRDPKSWVSFWGFAEKFLHNSLGGSYIQFVPNEVYNNFEIKYPVLNPEDAIIGNYKAPGDIIFKIIKQNGEYIGEVIDPGKVHILKNGTVLFNVKYDGSKYIGNYRRFYENDSYDEAPCTFTLTDKGISTDYTVKYQRID